MLRVVVKIAEEEGVPLGYLPFSSRFV